MEILDEAGEMQMSMGNSLGPPGGYEPWPDLCRAVRIDDTRLQSTARGWKCSSCCNLYVSATVLPSSGAPPDSIAMLTQECAAVSISASEAPFDAPTRVVPTLVADGAPINEGDSVSTDVVVSAGSTALDAITTHYDVESP